jgi:ribose 5-phosphate isomerase B
MGSDHAGYQLKEAIKPFLSDMGFEIEDIGPHNEDSVDYPDFGSGVSRMVAEGRYSRGILICGTGIGMSMVANRYPEIRAALCNDLFSAIMSRRHNDANILVMGGRVIGIELAKEIVRAWVTTPFDGGRHSDRLGKFCTCR